MATYTYIRDTASLFQKLSFQEYLYLEAILGQGNVSETFVLLRYLSEKQNNIKIIFAFGLRRQLEGLCRQKQTRLTYDPTHLYLIFC